MDIDEEVLKLLQHYRLPLEELKVIDAVWASREDQFVDSLLEYLMEMRNAR